MSDQTLRLLVGGALLVHGAGHLLGLWMPAESWLLAGLGKPVLRAISSIFWIASLAGVLAVCLSFLGVIVPLAWWRPLAVGTAIVSLAGLVIFWGNWPSFNSIGAVGMNIAILVALLLLRWPAVELFGA